MRPSLSLILLSLCSLVAAEQNGDVSYDIRFNKCFRIKIVEDNDDDGNSYFYNGAYRSQSMSFASFYACETGCGMCDYDSGFVTPLADYLEDNVEFVQGFCNQCLYQCNQRRLEDGNGGVDCNACKHYCYGQGSGNDETEYLNCQAAFQDNEGLQYYAGPTCGDDGSIVIGTFYDNECTIRHSGEQSSFSESFAYNTFHQVENICVDCASTDLCGNVMGNGYQCVDGTDANGQQDNMRVCKNYEKAMKQWTYAKARGRSLVPVAFLTMLLLGSFLFLSYTYYIRHSRAPVISKTELMEAAQNQHDNPDTNYAVMT